MSTQVTKKQLLEELSVAGRSSSRLSIIFREAVAVHMGISATDAECLDFLLEAGTATAGELAKWVGLTSGAMTAALDRLERAGYIRRESDPNDRRKVIVRPLPERFKSGIETYQTFAADVLGHMQHLTKAELNTIIQHYQMLSQVYQEQIDHLKADKQR